MCVCVRVYIYIYIESDRDSEATYHRVGKLIMEAHLSIHYGVIRLISRRNTRTEYVFFSIRFSNSFRDSFCFRFSVSSLDLSFLPDRVCFFSRFHANSRYTEITRKVIRKEKKKNKTRIVPGYFVSEAARRRIIDRVAGFFVVRRYNAVPAPVVVPLGADQLTNCFLVKNISFPFWDKYTRGILYILYYCYY